MSGVWMPFKSTSTQNATSHFQAQRESVRDEWQKFLNLCICQETHLDNVEEYKKVNMGQHTPQFVIITFCFLTLSYVSMWVFCLSVMHWTPIPIGWIFYQYAFVPFSSTKWTPTSYQRHCPNSITTWTQSPSARRASQRCCCSWRYFQSHW